MFEIFVIILILILVLAVIKLSKKLKQLDSKVTVKVNEPNDLVLALGQIPEGNYHSFIADPEGFAKAHTSAELISMMEKHKLDEVKECLEAAAEARKRERKYVADNYVGYHYAERNHKIALAFEQRAQRLIDDKNVFRSSAQLRTSGDSG